MAWMYENVKKASPEGEKLYFISERFVS